MNGWDNWKHPRKWGRDFFSSQERLNLLYDVAEELAEKWYATEARYFFNHHTEGFIEQHSRFKLQDDRPMEPELRLLNLIVENYLPDKSNKIPLGWLKQQFSVDILEPYYAENYVDRIIRSLHNTSFVVESSSFFDIRKTENLEGDRELEWLWKTVNIDNSKFELAYEKVMDRLNELIKEQPNQKELYVNYMQRLNTVRDKMADEVVKQKRKYKISLNNQPHQEPLNLSGEFGFFFEHMEEDDRKTIRHFFLHAEHPKEPMIYKTKKATYCIYYLGEKEIGKSAYKYEIVKERYFSLDIQTEHKQITGIKLLVVPERVTGKATITGESKPGEVFSSKVFHPKYNKVVGVKKNQLSGKYYLYLDFPKQTDETGLLVYTNPELFSGKNSDTCSKTMKVILELIAKTHNRKRKRSNSQR